jgi:hypothetical protein
MKNTLKTKLFEAMEKKLAENYPTMQESSRRKLASLFQEVSLTILAENIDGLSKSHADIALEMESHKKMFRDHLEAIQKHYKTVMESFKTMGVVKTEIDRKTQRPVMIGRTTVVTEMVVFLNYLNNLTMDFFENVYKIEDTKDYQNIQIKLF